MDQQPADHGPLAVIPARGGSKRIPRKNIRLFHGVPLIARTIGILRDAKLFDRIIVSTDDDEVMAVAVSAGAEAPFRRPAELSDDFTGTVPVIAHALRTIESAGERHDTVCCVYPAAILVSAADYRAAFSSLTESGADYVFTGARYSYPIQRALRQRKDRELELFFPEHALTRSQDLEQAYHDAGQFYLGRREAWLEQRSILAPRSRMHLLPADRVQDIDTPEDWDRAEVLWTLQRTASMQSGASADQ